MERRSPASALPLLALLLFSGSGEAPAAGGTTYEFLRMDVGARAAGVAGTFLTVTDDPTVLFYNPAALATLSVPRGSAGFFKHLLDVNSGHVSYAQEFPGLGWFGAGVVYTGYGSFDERDELGNMLGSFSANDLALLVGYANTYEGSLSYGANVKFIYSSIAGYSSTGLAADLGVLYTVPESRVTLGASLRNLGFQLGTYAGVTEDLPIDLSIGASVVPRGIPLLLNVGFHRLTDQADSFGDRFRSFTVGGEFTISRVFQLRVGYDNAVRQDLKIGTSSGLAGFSGGIGVAVGDYRLDYALSSLGKVGSLHRITVGGAF
jgi:long-subunit fatty acid transport protein